MEERESGDTESMVKEVYKWICPRCKKEISSLNIVQFNWNVDIHTKSCKEDKK
jgi:hypothetical protein